MEGVGFGAAHLLGRLIGAAAGEDRQAAEQTLLLGSEQVVRPLDRRAQRLLAGVAVASSLEQVEALREAFEQLLGREDGRARRCELERERQVVEPRAEPADRSVCREGRLERPRTDEEELDGLTLLERRHRVDLFGL